MIEVTIAVLNVVAYIVCCMVNRRTYGSWGKYVEFKRNMIRGAEEVMGAENFSTIMMTIMAIIYITIGAFGWWWFAASTVVTLVIDMYLNVKGNRELKAAKAATV